MSSIYSTFVIIILVQLFYSVAVSLYSYAFNKMGVTINQEFVAETQNLTSVSSKIESSLKLQTNIPIVDLGALLFYSGNLLIDMMLNFFFAIPSMATILIHFLGLMLNLDAHIVTMLKLVVFGFISVWYFLQIILFLVSLRSGRIIV